VLKSKTKNKMKIVDLEILGVKAMEVQKMRETCGGSSNWIDDLRCWLVKKGLFPRDEDINNRFTIRLPH
jgi:hypothetical protein